MLDLAQAVREQIVKETPPRKGETPRVMPGLRRLALWGATGPPRRFSLRSFRATLKSASNACSSCCTLVLAAAPATAPVSPDDLTPPPIAYGADIGSGLTILALRARWELLRSAHPELFQGLRPIVSVKEIPRANHVELRLVVGPLRELAAAAQLCALLTPFGLFCQPTVFDGQRLAMR